MADATQAPPSAGSVSVNTAGTADATRTPPPPPLGDVILKEVPPKIADLQRTVTISGTVTTTNPDGTIQLRTALGPVVLLPLPNLTQPLLPDLQIFLNIPPGNPPRSASAFLANNPLVTQGALGNPASSAASNSLNPSPSLAAAPAGIATGTGSASTFLRAVVLPSSLATLLSASSAAQTSSGILSGGAILSPLGNAFQPFTSSAADGAGALAKLYVTASNLVKELGQQNLTLPGLAPQAPQFLGTDAGVPASTGSRLADRLAATPAGTSLTLQLLAADSPAAGAFAGVISAQLTGGQTIVTVDKTPLLVKLPQNLPVGTNVHLSLVEGTLTADSGAPLDGRALTQLLATLRQLDPAAAQQAQSRLPQPGSQMPGALLFLFSALRSGELRTWLGDRTFAALEAGGQRERLQRAIEEFRAMSRGEAALSPVGEWRSWHLPWLDSMGMLHTVIHVHREKEEEKNTAARRGQDRTRFLIEMEFSKIGRLQLDGLVQRPTHRLDLIVRTDLPLPEILRRELLATYTDTVSAIGFVGHLLFQTNKQGWVVLRRAGPAHHEQGVTI